MRMAFYLFVIINIYLCFSEGGLGRGGHHIIEFTLITVNCHNPLLHTDSFKHCLFSLLTEEKNGNGCANISDMMELGTFKYIHVVNWF